MYKPVTEAAAASILLFWPAAFALGGNQAQEAEYARLKGEYDAVEETGIKIKCNLDPTVAVNNNTNTSIAANAVTVTDYYGQAEEEVDTKTYDKNIWAKALVESEGDEQKR